MGQTIMGQETVVTSTGITVRDMVKHGLSATDIFTKLGASLAPSFDKKCDLPFGMWVKQEVYDPSKPDDIAFTIYTVEAVDLEAGFSALSEDARRKVWEDGYKRRYVNAPAHNHIKGELGLVEKSVKKADEAKTVEKTLWDMAVSMVQTGLTATQLVSYTAGRITQDMADRAVTEVKANN